MKRLMATIAAIGLLAAAKPAQAGVDFSWTGGSNSWCDAGTDRWDVTNWPGGPVTDQRCDDHALINQANAPAGGYTVTFSGCGSTNFNTLMVCNLLLDANVAGPQHITLNVVDDALYAEQTTVTAATKNVTWDVDGGSFHPGDVTVTSTTGDFIIDQNGGLISALNMDIDATTGDPLIDVNGGLFRVQNLDMDSSSAGGNLTIDIDGGEFYASDVDMNAASSGVVTFAVDNAEAHIGTLDMISGTGAVALNIGVSTAPEVRIGRFEMSASGFGAATLNVDSGELLIGDLFVNGAATAAVIDLEVDVVVSGHFVINGNTTIDVADCKYFVADVFTIEGPTTVTKNGTGLFHSS